MTTEKPGIILWATSAIIATAMVLSAVGIASATHESDEVSVEHQARSAHQAIETNIDEMALRQEAVAIGHDAAAHRVADLAI